MEIKFRQKGEVVIINGFRNDSIPESIRPTSSLKGIDLTAYSVIYARFGRGGRKKAEELHDRAPKTIVIYTANWSNGFGEGVLLPNQFDPSRVCFYKNEEQVRVEIEEGKKKAAKVLYEEVIKSIPKIRVSLNLGYDGVEIKPDQEAFADHWSVRARSLEEAIVAVKKMQPVWEEWNKRALEAFLRHSKQKNPGNGNIMIYPSPMWGNKKVGVRYEENKYVVFEKRDGGWVETGTSLYGPPCSY